MEGGDHSRKSKMNDVKRKVMDILIKHKASRDNDNLLIAKYLKEEYGTTDIAVIATISKTNVCETITRVRRLIQATNPLLAPSKNASKARRRKEEKMREEMRKEI